MKRTTVKLLKGLTEFAQRFSLSKNDKYYRCNNCGNSLIEDFQSHCLNCDLVIDWETSLKEESND